MFFDQDILFGKGALALVWMAGNGEFGTRKGRRNREYQAVLQSNIKKICDHLTKLMPAMGTANGLTLKKMGTLVKGVGIIYSIKIENLARDVMQAMMYLKKPPSLGNPLIDMPIARSKKSKSKNTDAALPNLPVDGERDDDEYGALRTMEEIPQNFGSMELDVEAGFGGFRTPRARPQERLSDVGSSFQPRRILASPPPHAGAAPRVGDDPRGARKRARSDPSEENEETVYQDLLQRLRSGIDARAHCLREDDNILDREEERQPELEGFGDGFDMMRDLQFPEQLDQPFDDFAVPPLPGDNALGEMLPPPPRSDISSVTGLPSRLDSRSNNALETPVGAGTTAENTRRHRNEGRHRQDMTLQDLEEQTGLRGRGEVRRRLRLQIDRQTNFTLQEMLQSVNRAEEKRNDWDAIRRQLLDKGMAPPKSLWINLRVHSDPLKLAGRACPSSALTEMIEEIRHKQAKRKPQGREVARLDSTASMAGISTDNIGPHGRSGTRDLEPTLQDQSVENQGGDLDHAALPRITELENAADDVAPVFVNNDYNNNDGGVGVVEEIPQDFGFYQPEEPLGEPTEVPRKRRKFSVTNEESRLAIRLDGTKTFQELYPPGQVGKKRAAMAFFALLKMQSKKKVMLHQGEPYGPIAIETLNTDP